MSDREFVTQDRIEEREAEAVRTALDALRERVEAEAPNSWLRDRVLRLIDEARP